MMAPSITLAGSLVGRTGDARKTQQTRNQGQTLDRDQIDLGPLADQLRQLRLDYREQVLPLLEERERLIWQYRSATEEELVAIRKQLREHQAIIAETHRMFRRNMWDQIREIRDERRVRILDQGG